jgi:hypothetical protein
MSYMLLPQPEGVTVAKRNKASKRVNRNDYVRAPDGFEGWVTRVGEGNDPRGGPSGVIEAEVKGPMGTRKFNPKELVKIPRTDGVPNAS